MYAEDRTSGMMARILPDLAAVSDAARDGWRPEITDAGLRAELFGSDALAEAVLDDLLRGFGLPGELSFDRDADRETLDFLLDGNFEVAARRAGMAIHGHQLARLVYAGRLNPAEAGWDTDDLRFALAMRALGTADDVAEEAFVAAVRSAGEASLAAWLGQLPDAVRRALEISRHFSGHLPTAGQDGAATAGIFAECVARMRNRQ